jgi:hypothetical protein
VYTIFHLKSGNSESLDAKEKTWLKLHPLFIP